MKNSRDLATSLADRLRLRGRARGVVLGRYRFTSRATGRTTFGSPICSIEALRLMSDADLLKRPGCGRRTLASIRDALRWAQAN